MAMLRRKPAPAGRRYPAEVLPPAEVEALLRACSRRAPTGIRNRALIAVLYRAGLRIGEALALEPKDLDPAAGTVRVLRGKGGQARTVALDAGAFALVDRWQDVRARLGLGARQPLFCTRRGRALHASYVRRLLPRLARRAGIARRVHPHALRHTHAVELAREGLPMPWIQAQLGHANLETTSRYLAHFGAREVIDAIRRRPAWHEA